MYVWRADRRYPYGVGSVIAYLSDGVGGTAVGDLGGVRAVGGNSRHDLSGVGDVAVGRGASGSGKNGSSGELHLD